MNEATSAFAGGGRELIAFRVGEQEFCVDIMAVRELRGWTQTTPLPDSPAYVRGVINLRGSVLPVIDMGARIGLPPSETGARTVIIVGFTRNDFQKIVEILHADAGIALSDTKAPLVYSRLVKRLRVLGLGSFARY